MSQAQTSHIPEEEIFRIAAQKVNSSNEVTFDQCCEALDSYRSLHPETASFPVRGARWEKLRDSYLEQRAMAHDQFLDQLESRRNALLEAWHQAKERVSDPQFWRDCRHEFRQLKDEETEGVRRGEFKRSLRTYGNYESWGLLDGDSAIRSHFEEIATRAGQRLSCLREFGGSDFWQTCLLFYLHETDSKEVFTSYIGTDHVDSGGMIRKPLKASEELCSSLAVKAERVRWNSGAPRPNSTSAPRSMLSAFDKLVGKLIKDAEPSRCKNRRLPPEELEKILAAIDKAGLKPINNLEGRSREELAQWNKTHPSHAIHTFGDAFRHPRFRRSVSRRLSRANSNLAIKKFC